MFFVIGFFFEDNRPEYKHVLHMVTSLLVEYIPIIDSLFDFYILHLFVGFFFI